MTAYDALLGTISQDGVEVELGNGLNITGGLTVERNPATGKLDISGAAIGGAGGTTTTASYVQPAASETVQVSVGSSAGLTAGQALYIEGGGSYELVSVDSAFLATVRNLGATGNAAPAVVVPSGAIVAPGGGPGLGAAQPSLRIFTLSGVENIRIDTHIELTDYPYNAKASTATGSATTTAGSPAVTLAAAGDWANRDGIFIAKAGASAGLLTPALPTAAVLGTTGATARTYRIVAMTAGFGQTAMSPTVTPANTNATLTTDNYVRIRPPLLAVVDGYVRGNIANLAAFTVAQSNRTYIAGERVVLMAQTAGAQNGIYVVGTVTAGTAPLTRSTDFDSGAEVSAASGFFIPVRSSRGYGNGRAGIPSMLQVTSGAVTLDTTPITFSEEVETILVYVNDSRTAGADKLLGGMATRTTFWYASLSVLPDYHFDDFGQAIVTPDSWINTIASATPVNNSFIARIIAGAGTTTLTLDRNVPTSVVAQTARHDNVLALQEAIDSCSAQGSSVGRRIEIPENAAKYRFHAGIEVDKQVDIRGRGIESTALEWCGGCAMLRIRGVWGSRYQSTAAYARIRDLQWTSSNRALPNGGDYMTAPYDQITGTYNPANGTYSPGTYTDSRKLSYKMGGAVIAYVRCSIEHCEGTFTNSTALSFDAQSDDTLDNCNDFVIDGFIASSVSHGHGVAVHGYDASNGRCNNVYAVGITEGAGVWDAGFTGSHWNTLHTASCYLTGAFITATSTAELFGPYFEGGQENFRCRIASTVFGGNFGSGVDLNGCALYGGSQLTPGLQIKSGTAPNRVVTTLGSSAASGFVHRQSTESTSVLDLRTTWDVASAELQRFVAGSTVYITDAIATASVKIYGGLNFARGILMGAASVRRAWRSLNGVPGTSLETIFEPGDFLVDINTGRQIQVKARCVSSATVWGAASNRVQGRTIVPTTNNALNRGFVCQVSGTTGGSEPNWDAVADNATLVDNTITWMCWGTTGSGVPQFDLPLEATNGPDLGDTSPTLQIGNGARYRRKADVQTANRAPILGVTGVEDGDMMIFECNAHASYTLAITDGGSGGGILYTVPAARTESVSFRYDLATTQWKYAGKVRSS